MMSPDFIIERRRLEDEARAENRDVGRRVDGAVCVFRPSEPRPRWYLWPPLSVWLDVLVLLVLHLLLVLLDLLVLLVDLHLVVVLVVVVRAGKGQNTSKLSWRKQNSAFAGGDTANCERTIFSYVKFCNACS